MKEHLIIHILFHWACLFVLSDFLLQSLFLICSIYASTFVDLYFDLLVENWVCFELM